MDNTLYLNRAHHIGLSAHDRRQHILISGIPSTGVSVFTVQLLLQDIQNGQKVILLDPYGDKIDNLLSRLSDEQLKNTAYIDAGNAEYPVGLNLFETGNDQDKYKVAQAVLDLMYSLYDPGRTGIIGPRFENALRNAVMTVLYEGKCTFIELMRCLTDEAYVKAVLPEVTDPFIKRYWSSQMSGSAKSSEVLDYIVSKFGRFIFDSRVRNVIGQTSSTFSFPDLLMEKNTILINLNKLRSEAEQMKIISEIILLKLNYFLTSRTEDDPGIALYIDEVERYSGGTLSNILKTGRNYGLTITGISQRIADAEPLLRSELLRSGTLISFRLSSVDAEFLAPELHMRMTKDQLCMMKKYMTVIKTLKDGNPVIYEQVNTEALADKKPLTDIEKYKEEQLKKYGRKASEAQEDIFVRLKDLK